MVRARREQKSTEEVWREIIERCQQSGLTPEEFCERERYSIEPFRWFREKLFGISEPPGLQADHDKTSQDDVAVDATVELRSEKNLIKNPQQRTICAPVHSVVAEQSTISTLEIVLRNGVLLRVKSTCSAQLLRSVVKVLEEVL